MDAPGHETSGTIAFDVVVTMGDRIAFDRHVFRQRIARGEWAGVAIAGCVAAPVVAFVVVLIAKLALAGSACDLDEALSAQERLRMFLQATAGVAVLEASAAVALLALRGRIYEAATRAKVRRRPGVDAADPDLREASRCNFDAAGFRIDGPGLFVGGGWVAAHGFEETPDHMFLMIGPRAGFVMPKRDLPPGTVLAVRDLARANLRDLRPRAGAAPR